MAKKRQKLGEILQDWKMVSRADADRAAEFGLNNGKRIGECLQELELVSEEDVTKALASQHGMEYVDLSKNLIQPDALSLVPEELIKRNMILPISNTNGRLKIVIHDPLDLDTIDLVRFRVGVKDIEPVIAPKSRIRAYIDKYLEGPEKSLDELSQSLDASVVRRLRVEPQG